MPIAETGTNPVQFASWQMPSDHLHLKCLERISLSFEGLSWGVLEYWLGVHPMAGMINS
jgi:hypothetical protein